MGEDALFFIASNILCINPKVLSGLLEVKAHMNAKRFILFVSRMQGALYCLLVNNYFFALAFSSGCASYYSPFQIECLRSIWVKVGCLKEGLGYPKDLASAIDVVDNASNIM